MAPEGFVYTVLDLETFATREMYGKVLAEIAEGNPDIVVLTADLMRSNKTVDFARVFPDRYFNFGIAEQNMMGAAAGFAISGKIPYASTFAAFASMRACEQIRTDIDYPKLNVRIVSTHSGLSMGNGGTTHHATEDIAILRSMANMTVMVPADAVETAKIIRASVDYPGPIYIRLGRGAEPIVYKEDYDFEIGKAITMRDGKDATVIACGICVMAAVKAARKLEREGLDLRVVNMHTVKPIDTEAILKAASETQAIVTAEEHNIVGGLGSAVAEVLADNQAGIKFKRLGIPDVYTEIGSPQELCHRYGIDEDGIYDAIYKLFDGEFPGEPMEKAGSELLEVLTALADKGNADPAAEGNIKALEGQALQLNVTDGDGVYLTVKDGKLCVEKGMHENPGAAVIGSEETFTELFNGELDPMGAIQEGKLSIEGDVGPFMTLNLF